MSSITSSTITTATIPSPITDAATMPDRDDAVPWRISQRPGRIPVIEWDAPTRAWEGWLLCRGDAHHDNPHCDRTLEYRHLRMAKERGAAVIDIGDCFCAMQGRWDKRSNKDTIRPEHQHGNYLDLLVDTTAEDYAPYARNFAVLGTGNHECHDDLTEVLTERGWVPFKDYDPEVPVATLHVLGGHVEWHKPTHVHVHDYDGDLVRWSGRGYDFAVTPEHRMLYKGQGRVRDADEWTWRTAGWLAEKKQHVMRVPLAAASGNDDFAISDDWLRLLGWLITDGSVSAEKRVVALFQRPEKAHHIRGLLERLGLEFRERERVRDIKVICGKALKKPPQPAIEFHVRGASRDEVFKHLQDKYTLPWWMGLLSDRQVNVLLEAMILGNGTRPTEAPTTKERAYGALYGRKDILDQIQALLVTHNWRAYISEYRPGSWVLHICDMTTGTLTAEPEALPYKGKVYCLTVPNSTLITRRNGKVLISGNSAIEKKHESNLTTRLVERMRLLHHSPVLAAGYSFFVKLRVRYGRQWQSRIVWGFHGGGGGGPVTRDVIQAQRQRAFIENCDLSVTGHTHDSWLMQSTKLSVNQYNRVERRILHQIKTSSYKDTYRAGEGGWEVEKQMPPKPLGAWFVRLYFDGRDLCLEPTFHGR